MQKKLRVAKFSKVGAIARPGVIAGVIVAISLPSAFGLAVTFVAAGSIAIAIDYLAKSFLGLTWDLAK